MLEPKTKTQFSFESLLSWAGKFTPQFKFKMSSARRQLEPDAFDTFVRDTLQVFRQVLCHLAALPPGGARARATFALMDASNDAPDTVSCGVGCNACCRMFAKEVTNDEADLLASLVKSGEVSIDIEAVRTDARALESSDPDVRRAAQHAACPFLDEEGGCKVYAARPSVCRKYYSLSPRESCATQDAPVVPHISLMPELIASAAMTLPGNDTGLLQSQLVKRLG